VSAGHEVVVGTDGDRSWSLRLETFPVPQWFAQQNSWVQDPQNSDSAVYNYPLRLSIRGPLDSNALEKSLDELIRRHASLRSIFRVRGQLLTQIVLPERTCPLETVELNLDDEQRRDSQAREVASQKARLPFDLTSDSPFRATLLRLGPEAHDLIIVAHHLVYDDWSNTVLTDELSAIYKAMVERTPSPLPELPFQYGDFVRWSQRRFGDKEIEAHILFWRQQLQGRANFHHFHPDHAPSGQIVRRAGREKLSIENGLAKMLRVWTRQQRASLFMALMAGFQLLLSRYSRQDDIAVGSCVANRMRVELESLIGRFGNHVVVRTNFDGNPTLREALLRVRESSLRAYTYQEVPFGTVLDAIRPPSEARCDRLLQTMFVFKNAPKSAWQMPGVEIRWVPVETDTTKYDLTVWLQEHDGVEVTLEYNADLFDAETIRELLSQYHRLLSMMADNPEAHADEFHLTPRMPLPEPAPAPVQPAPTNGNGRWKWRFERSRFPRTKNGT
jgi:hypothetical protein